MPAVALPARDLTITYDTAGAGDPPLVLLHAFPLDRGLWASQLVTFAAARRVIAPDLPGFGESSAGNEPFTVDSVADAVADFLAALGVGKAVVGGLSMGGYVAMAFARRHPSRLAGLILADTKAEADDDTARANRDKTIALAREKGVSAVVETMLPKLVADPGRADVADRVRELGGRQSVAGVTAALAALRDRPDATAGLADMTVPTLVIVGEHDAVTPVSAAERIAATVKGSKLVVVPGAGHLSNLENTTAFDAAVKEFPRR